MPKEHTMNVELQDLEVLTTLINDNKHNESAWRTLEKLAQRAQKKLQKRK